MAFYPKFSSDALLSLKVVSNSLAADPNYLDAKDCPYEREDRALLRRLAAVQVEEPEGEMVVAGEVDHETTLIQLLTDMDTMNKGLGDLAPNEKIAFFKAKAQLVEKLISLQERVENLKHIQDFRSLVMETLETVLNKDQLNDFMEKLNAIR